MLRLAMPIDWYEARARHLAGRGLREIPVARGFLDEDRLANAEDARAVVRTPLRRQMHPTVRLLLRLEMRSSGALMCAKCRRNGLSTVEADRCHRDRAA